MSISEIALNILISAYSIVKHYTLYIRLIYPFDLGLRSVI